MKKTKSIYSAFLILLPVIIFSCAFGGGSGYEASVMPYYTAGRTSGEIMINAPEQFDPRNFDQIIDNTFLHAGDYPLSTFSADVDTAGYSITRRYLENGKMPPASAIRIEELINYFDYDYPPPSDGKPFAVHTEVGTAPWNPNHYLARIAIKGMEFPVTARPKVNLVFLVDVSGSMSSANRLPLLIESLKLLVNELNGDDRAAICVYAGSAGTVLPPTSCDEKEKILRALDRLQAGGSTAGGEGIMLAYNLAQQNFDPRAVNRVILCTDGDFNVGIRSRDELLNLVSEKAGSGVYLTILGFGINNFQDGTMKQLASRGNGNYGYIDNIDEARKILVQQLSGTLITIAQDVKIQVEFNSENAGAYRLIGYENRLMRDEDFGNDTQDAGDIGAGHTVTAFYEIIPAGSEANALPRRDQLKYGPPEISYVSQYPDELLTVKVRYKLPHENTSALLDFPVLMSSIRQAGGESQEFRFAASVAAFGMLLRNSEYKGNAAYGSVISMAENSLGEDKWAFRKGFVELVKKAESLGRL